MCMRSKTKTGTSRVQKHVHIQHSLGGPREPGGATCKADITHLLRSLRDSFFLAMAMQRSFKTEEMQMWEGGEESAVRSSAAVLEKAEQVTTLWSALGKSLHQFLIRGYLD